MPGCSRMSGTTLPLGLHRLLDASEESDRNAAWDQLIGEHTRLLLAVASSFGGDRDVRMDRYAYVLEKLREGSFRRLRTFDPSRGAKFSTWLTLTARHFCLDYDRSRYGRRREAMDPAAADQERRIRRQLLDCVGDEPTLDTLADDSLSSAERVIIRAERVGHLRRVVRELEPHDRLLLALRFEDGRSASTIAGVLGLPTPFHVYRQLNTVLARLRRCLADRGIDGAID
jgi:RNA polymerase sigma factor (sigma-70 family)